MVRFISKIATTEKIWVRIQLNENTFPDVASWAVKSGVRHPTCVLYPKDVNKSGAKGKANTKSLAKFFRFCFEEYKKGEPEREEKAKIKAERERQLKLELAMLNGG